jgi:hypothetical protein
LTPSLTMTSDPNENSIQIKSYPERLSSLIPLPGWLVWVIFWQVLFLVDYLLSWQLSSPAYGGAFACLCLFFTSVCVVVIYCSKVLVRLFSHMLQFIDEEKSILTEWYTLKLKSAYEGAWPLISGLIISISSVVSIYPIIQQLTPTTDFLFYYRVGYISLGFFFLGVSLWALIKVSIFPMELTRMKVKVSVSQFSGNGLQALGSSFLKMSLAICVSFLLIVMTTIVAPFQNNLIVLIWLGLAALLIFGFFILPQVGIHRIMRNEKTNRMFSFTRHLEAALDKTLNDPSAENMQHLKELFEVQNHLKSMHEWPFDFNSVWQLLTALIIPILLAALEILYKA